jgi:hypothetical protein
MADAIRIKATELAVELLRGAVPGAMVEAVLRAPEAPTVGDSATFGVTSDELAHRLGVLVEKVASQIESRRLL